MSITHKLQPTHFDDYSEKLKKHMEGLGKSIDAESFKAASSTLQQDFHDCCKKAVAVLLPQGLSKCWPVVFFCTFSQDGRVKIGSMEAKGDVQQTAEGCVEIMLRASEELAEETNPAVLLAVAVYSKLPGSLAGLGTGELEKATMTDDYVLSSCDASRSKQFASVPEFNSDATVVSGWKELENAATNESASLFTDSFGYFFAKYQTSAIKANLLKALFGSVVKGPAADSIDPVDMLKALMGIPATAEAAKSRSTSAPSPDSSGGEFINIKLKNVDGGPSAP